MSRKKYTPRHREFLMIEVVGTQRLSPNIVRVTFAGLGEVSMLGDDHWCRLFLPREGQDVLRLPTNATEVGWYLQYLATPKANRPWVRAYTIRDARPAVGEVDIDFVIHGHHDGSIGPAAEFALSANRGDRIGFLDQGSAFRPDHPHEWTLLVGDETAMPAIAGICRSLPASTRGMVILEIPTAADRQDFSAPPGVEVNWIHRDEQAEAVQRPGKLALDTLKAASLPDGDVHAHLIGESALATGARRHLVQDRGIPARHVDFVGYWRYGRPSTT